MPRRAWGGLLPTALTESALARLLTVSMPRRAWGGLLLYEIREITSTRMVRVSMPRRAWGGLLLISYEWCSVVIALVVSMPRRAWGGLLLTDIRGSRVVDRETWFQCPEGLGGDCYWSRLEGTDASRSLTRFNAPKGLGGIATIHRWPGMSMAMPGTFQCPEGLGGDCYDWYCSSNGLRLTCQVSMPRRAWGGLLRPGRSTATGS